MTASENCIHCSQPIPPADLVADRISLVNQLVATLESFWPGAAAIFANVDSLIALTFLARYSTPSNRANGQDSVTIRSANLSPSAGLKSAPIIHAHPGLAVERAI